ncbi:hypothetical protein [Streptomyces sp. NBC_01237]|uniref:hypothetical protein n=1 Tax=Streptomyces sp. NBC_01237 TaxID=2903790 RepID=UPI002DDC341D|nr:hypothetical protein [Streptomyces sp. NBC_01237]WRZ73907.1 hypothetical protein OG251_20995 [Streptomyces sp. NBC_01237]
MESYTPAEKRERNRLFRKGARQALADCVDPRLEHRIQEIDRSAAERGARELQALHNVQEQARNDLARAKATERTTPRAERAAAKQARKDVEKRVRLAERAVSRAES